MIEQTEGGRLSVAADESAVAKSRATEWNEGNER